MQHNFLLEIPNNITPEFHTTWNSTFQKGISDGDYENTLHTVKALREKFPNIVSFCRAEAHVSSLMGSFWEAAAAWNDINLLASNIPTGVPEQFVLAHNQNYVVLDGVKIAVGKEWDTVVSDEIRFALVNGGYERAERQAISHFLAAEDCVLELGAGSGYMGIRAKKLYPEIKYTAVEANQNLLPYIDYNQALNEVMFEVIHSAIGPHNGETSFDIGSNFLASHCTRFSNADTASKTIVVPQRKLSDLIKETKANCLIMDIEGGEYECLVDSPLTTVNKILLEIHPQVIGRSKVTYLVKHIIEQGFELETQWGSNDVICFVKSGLS